MNNINHDLLFKELLTTFFQEFMEAFFPEADQMLDYSYLEFLTQEIIVDITTGKKKYVDICSAYMAGRRNCTTETGRKVTLTGVGRND